MKEIDARGRACPEPVLQTKATLEEDAPGEVKVVVDNEASQQNVKRFLESQGFETAFETDGNDFIVIGRCRGMPLPQLKKEPEIDAEQKKIMIMCATDRIGYGDDELGLKLMANFIRTLKEMGPELWRLVLVNNGVRLTIEGSEILADLKDLEDSGLTILVCGTCLDHFNLLDMKQVGETTNMLDIVSAMQLADKVINI
jgi:selenium metabolism protein YedF